MSGKVKEEARNLLRARVEEVAAGIGFLLILMLLSPLRVMKVVPRMSLSSLMRIFDREMAA